MENNEESRVKIPENLPEVAKNPLELAKIMISVLDERRARTIKLLHVEKKTIIADYFIICSGTSNTQIRALANELEFKLGEGGLEARHIDGLPEATWVVLDYASVIVHIFNGETRNFYNLEKLWNESEEVDISDYLKKD